MKTVFAVDAMYYKAAQDSLARAKKYRLRLDRQQARYQKLQDKLDSMQEDARDGLNADEGFSDERRLKPLALPFYAALLGLSVFQSAVGPFFSEALRMLVAQHGIWPLSAGPVLNGLFLWYVWRLKQKGILHAQQGAPADASALRAEVPSDPSGPRRG